jgi:CHC2 zinc finger/RepB DNA-primase from phage plasmid
MSSNRTRDKAGVAAVYGSNSHCLQYLAALFSDAAADSFIEARVRVPGGMRAKFFSVAKLAAVGSYIQRAASHADVYVGVLPRRRPSGTRTDVVTLAAVLWADCDTAESVAALDKFLPEPAIVVASGSGYNKHAYWLLAQPVSIDELEVANRKLARLLGADERCADAARILRPPSLNHKHHPPRTVRLFRCEPSHKRLLHEIVGAADDVVRVAHVATARQLDRGAEDPLLAIAPVRYIEELARLAVPRHRKVSCPFHEDATPSLHVYDDPRRGWYCFGCGRGGSIYDFAALLWRMQTRGDQFLELRRRLDLLFDHTDLSIT